MKKIALVLVLLSMSYAVLPVQENTYDYVPQERIRVMCPYEFDLCGVNILIPFYVPHQLPVVWGNTKSTLIMIVTKIFIVYTEATDASAPVTNQIRIGTETGSNDYYADFTPRANAAQWDVDTILPSSFNSQGVYNDGNHEVMLIRSVGGKAGTGKVMISVELSRNIEDMVLPN